MVKHLLEKQDIEVNAATNNGATPLFHAACKGHLEAVQRLLAQKGIEVNKADNNGFTPLYIAAVYGHLEVVKHLLEKQDIEVNKANDNGVAPLHVAAQEGYINIGAILIYMALILKLTKVEVIFLSFMIMLSITLPKEVLIMMNIVLKN